MSDDLPAFDFVVATVGRVDELAALLGSIERQAGRFDRVIVVDQNGDDRLAEVLGRHASIVSAHLASERGLSRARNAALPSLREDAVVGFPDDDCSYPDGLLERLRGRFAADEALDGLTGRTVDATGFSPGRVGVSGRLTRETVWNSGNSASMFLRSAAVSEAGGFDEQFGLGAGTPWSSGEDIDLLIRAVRSGGAIIHDPTLVVWHPPRSLEAEGLTAIGARDGATVGRLLRKHGYPRRSVIRMLFRPLCGVLVSFFRRDLPGARFQLATFRGRVRGYRARP